MQIARLQRQVSFSSLNPYHLVSLAAQVVTLLNPALQDRSFHAPACARHVLLKQLRELEASSLTQFMPPRKVHSQSTKFEGLRVVGEIRSLEGLLLQNECLPSSPHALFRS